jgi:succinoglycan biosynthesis transport protein ExoP
MANTQAGNSLSIFALLDGLRRRKWLVVIPAIVLTAGFAAYAYRQPDRYRGTALLAAEQTTAPEFLKHVAPAPLEIQSHLWAVREVLFSPPVLEAAARQMTLYKESQEAIPPKVLEDLKSDVNITVDGDHAFKVSYESGDRYDARNVTNTLVEEFVRQASAKHEEKAGEQAAVIDTELDALRKRMEDQSKKLHDYKSKTVHILPEHMLENMRVVDDLKDQLRDREEKISLEESRRTTIQRQIDDLEAKGVLEQPMIHEKTADELKLEDLKLQEKQLATRYTPKMPEVIQLRKQIADLERATAAQPKAGRNEPSPTWLKYNELKAELDGINQKLPAYRRDIQSLQAQISTYSRRVEATPQVERRVEDLKRELDVGESQFHALLDKKQDAELAKGLAESESGIAFSVVESASLPSAPYSPQRERIILMGLAAGLGLGLALAFLMEQNDSTFGTVDDFQAFTTLPVAGVIPNVVQKGSKKGARPPIVTVTDPDSVAAEQYRILAMKVQQQCDATQSKVVMITSAAGGEGKSLTALNLAVALSATTDGSVLLIDADMRKPRVNEYLSLNVPAGKGFHNLLVSNDEKLENYVVKVKNLHVIPGSVPTANPVAALSSPKARALFERLKQNFTYVIVDAPPTLPIADSHILSGLSDKVLFVVRARSTPRELFQHALESFDATNVLGAVVNDVDYQRSRYAYAYEYYKKTA